VLPVDCVSQLIMTLPGIALQDGFEVCFALTR